MENVKDDWDRHWTDYSEAAALNPAQEYRRRLACSLLGLNGSERILDVGSGHGDLVAYLRSCYPDAHLCGIDYSQAGVQISAAKVPSARFIQRDLLDDAEPPPELRGWASHAVCSEVLEHVDDPRKLLARAAAYMAPGGRLVVTVPGGPMSAFDKHIGHRRHYSAGSLRNLLTSSGYEVEAVMGAGFPFFNLYRLTVIARGKKLVSDMVSGDASQLSSLARFTMSLFRGLFRLNLSATRFGWQIVGVARRAADGPHLDS